MRLGVNSKKMDNNIEVMINVVAGVEAYEMLKDGVDFMFEGKVVRGLLLGALSAVTILGMAAYNAIEIKKVKESNK